MIADSNIVIDLIDDLLKPDNGSALQYYAARHRLSINEIIFAEISAKYATAEAVHDVIAAVDLRVVRLSLEECFRAGVAFRAYRHRGGPREAILPDFLIGAQASVRGWPILTRDARRFATYFPEVELIDPTKDQND